MSQTSDVVAEDIIGLIRQNAVEAGVDLAESLTEATAYAAERAEHLASIVGEIGFEEAVQAERDSVLLRATSDAIQSADQIDARLLGIVEGAMTLGARAIAVAVL